MIKTEQVEDRQWSAHTDVAPFMRIIADTEAVAIDVIERSLVWYEERRVTRETAKAVEAQILELPAKPIVDTAPSEITIYDESQYMDGA